MYNNLNFDENIWDFVNDTKSLCKISDIISRDREDFFKKEGDFIKAEPTLSDTISFIPKSKLSIAKDGFNEKKYRVNIKVGRFVKKLLKKEILQAFYVTDSDIEYFVNLFKSYFNTDISNFKVINGKEIKKWYLEDNYFSPNNCRYGTLWNSCMRYSEKNSYMNIYADNLDQIKMLIHVDESGKLRTRALLWEGVTDKNGNTYKVMDRIYSFYDHEVTSFKQWASENGYIFKYEQSAKSERLFTTPDGVKDLQLKINLNAWKTFSYPYIDTFKFLNFEDGVLSNSSNFKYDYILVQNDGGLERYEEEPEPEMDENW
jgi:hypothetical protein